MKLMIAELPLVGLVQDIVAEPFPAGRGDPVGAAGAVADA